MLQHATRVATQASGTRGASARIFVIEYEGVTLRERFQAIGTSSNTDFTHVCMLTRTCSSGGACLSQHGPQGVHRCHSHWLDRACSSCGKSAVPRSVQAVRRGACAAGSAATFAQQGLAALAAPRRGACQLPYLSMVLASGTICPRRLLPRSLSGCAMAEQLSCWRQCTFFRKALSHAQRCRATRGGSPGRERT
jgi:hypothetical protein